MSTTRKRLPSEESRRAALEAARSLLIESGPQSITLKAVSARIGRTHANLLHHFGSASELQQALAGYLASTVCESISEAVHAVRAGTGSVRAVVDMAFDAFDQEGGAALTRWMLLTGNENTIDPIIAAVQRIVDELRPEELAEGASRSGHETTMALVLLALGDALIGERLAQSLHVGRSTARDRAEVMLRESMGLAETA